VTTGLRPEELYGLRWKDVNIAARRLTVNQVLSKTRRKKGEEVARFQFGPPKTEKSRRTLDFPAFVAQLLAEEHRRVIESRSLAGEKWEENGLLFPSEVGTPLEERNVLRRFQAVCEANGLPKLRVYDLRHTHASLLIHEGVHPKKIAERLGHSSIKLTMDTYGHLFEGSDHDSADKMEKLLAPKKAGKDGGNITFARSAHRSARPSARRTTSKAGADKTADKNSKARVTRARKLLI
jgi:integrase